MKRFYFTILLIGILTLVACSNGDEDAEGEDGKLQVVTTYSILYDIVKNVGGDLVSIHSLAPVGSDPHEYDPLPLDVQKTTDADVIFYNGLNLETGNAWFERLLETTGKDSEDAYVFRLSEGIEPKYLSSEGLEGMEDPHAWLNIAYGIKYVENARDALIVLDPDNEETYKVNAENYISELESLHERAISEFSEIPEEQRILVTSEGAFKYFAEAYGFTDEYIWEINQEEEGDVMGIGLKWEVKRRKDGFKTLYKWLENEREKPDALAIRADRKPWLVVIPLERFLKIIKGGKENGANREGKS